MEDFQLFWDLYNPDPRFYNRRAATQIEWQKRSEKARKDMIGWLRNNPTAESRNPYFFVQDFRETIRQELSYNDYYRRYGTDAEKDGWQRRFLPDEHRTIYVRD